MVGRFVIGGLELEKDEDVSNTDQVDPNSVGPGVHLLHVVSGATVSASPAADACSVKDGSVCSVVDDGFCQPPEDTPHVESDPWAVAELTDTSDKWSELTLSGKLYRFFVQWIGKFLVLITLLYFFVCSLDFLCSAFRLLGGKAAGSAFSDSTLLQNPIAGLMIGVLATVLVQSSSTSSSIIVTMVASGIIQVRPAIPIIMGANIGTSVTNTIVSLAQSANRDEFRRAFGGATVHDMFNWLSVFVLLPLEIASGYMYHLTSKMVSMYSLDHQMKDGNTEMLQTITKPFTELIIQLDSKVIEGIAIGDLQYSNKSLIKEWCSYTTIESQMNLTEFINETFSENMTKVFGTIELRNISLSVPLKPCRFLFHNTGLYDTIVGVILLIISLAILCGCLILMVKVLNSALRGSMMTLVKRVINADLPGPLSYFTGYIAMLVGAGLTMLVQSSSVFTSALTPLVGIGVIQIERVYPLTLGSNIGTTTTGILAALAASSSDYLKPALQIALCHLCFNISGILLFYPIPFMRLPIRMAKVMGNTTAKYRWFAIFYVVLMFFLLPLFVFGLSMAGTVILSVVCGIFMGLFVIVISINILQNKRPNWLPKKLRNWKFLPLWMHSLEPFDRIISKVVAVLRRVFCCCCCCQKCTPNQQKETSKHATSTDVEMTEMGLLSKKETEGIDSHFPSVPSTTSVWSLEVPDSAYASAVNTPRQSPNISRLPSYVAIIEAEEDGH